MTPNIEILIIVNHFRFLSSLGNLLAIRLDVLSTVNVKVFRMTTLVEHSVSQPKLLHAKVVPLI